MAETFKAFRAPGRSTAGAMRRRLDRDPSIPLRARLRGKGRVETVHTHHY